MAGVLDQSEYAVAKHLRLGGTYEENTPRLHHQRDTAYPERGVLRHGGRERRKQAAGPASVPALALRHSSKSNRVGKLVKIENSRTDIGPHLTGVPAPDPTSIAGRPDFPYTSGPPFDYQNRISSDDNHSSFNQTLYPFVAQGYTFHKTVRFSPRGEASINGTYVLRRVAELGLKPAHGTVVDLSGANVVAIQFSGVTGKCKVYRQ